MGERGGGVLERARAYLEANGGHVAGIDRQNAAARSYLRGRTDSTANGGLISAADARSARDEDVLDDDEYLGGSDELDYPFDSDDEDDEEARREEEELRQLKQQHAKYAPPLRDVMLPHGWDNPPPPRPNSLPALNSSESPEKAANQGSSRRASERRATSQMGVVIKGAGGHGYHGGRGSQSLRAGSNHGKNLRLNVTAKFKQLSALH